MQTCRVEWSSSHVHVGAFLLLEPGVTRRKDQSNNHAKHRVIWRGRSEVAEQLDAKPVWQVAQTNVIKAEKKTKKQLDQDLWLSLTLTLSWEFDPAIFRTACILSSFLRNKRKKKGKRNGKRRENI